MTQFSAATVTTALAQVRTTDTVAVVSTDRRQLTVTASTIITGARGLINDFGGAAWLDLGAYFQGPVRILRGVSASVVELAEPLPHSVPTTAAGSLRWNLWSCQLTAAQVGATVQRNVRWSITWTPTQGGDLPADPVTEQGFIHVVRTPFNTGLTDDGIAALIPEFPSMVPRRQGSYAPQRWVAQQEIEAMLRLKVPSGRTEDQALGEQFVQVHALLTAAVVLEGHASVGIDRSTQAAEFRQRAWVRFGEAMQLVTWIDLDGDGVVDDGETGVRATGLGEIVRAHVFDSALFDDNDEDDLDPIPFDRVRAGEPR